MTGRTTGGCFQLKTDQIYYVSSDTTLCFPQQDNTVKPGSLFTAKKQKQPHCVCALNENEVALLKYFQK